LEKKLKKDQSSAVETNIFIVFLVRTETFRLALQTCQNFLYCLQQPRVVALLAHYLLQVADQGNRMSLPLFELGYYLFGRKVGQNCLPCCPLHSLIFISETQDDCPEVLNPEPAQTPNALNLGQRLSFGHPLNKQQLSLRPKCQDILSSNLPYP
jgi:hypothetical protein